MLCVDPNQQIKVLISQEREKLLPGLHTGVKNKKSQVGVLVQCATKFRKQGSKIERTNSLLHKPLLISYSVMVWVLKLVGDSSIKKWWLRAKPSSK